MVDRQLAEVKAERDACLSMFDGLSEGYAALKAERDELKGKPNMTELKTDQAEVVEIGTALEKLKETHLKIIRIHVAEAMKWKDAYINLREYCDSKGFSTVCRVHQDIAKGEKR